MSTLSNEFRWEECGGLEHHCGVCQTPLHSQHAKVRCIGEHVEPCCRYHQQLHLVGHGHDCSYCKSGNAAHLARHKRMVELLRQIELAGFLVERSAYGFTVYAESSQEVSATPATPSGKRREKKEAKKLTKAKTRPRIGMGAELDKLNEILHPEQANVLSSDQDNAGLAPMLARLETSMLPVQANLSPSKGQTKLATDCVQTRFSIEVSAEDMHHVLRNLGVPKPNVRLSIPKDITQVIKRLEDHIRDDLRIEIQEGRQTMKRMASYWRYVNKRTYNAMIERNQIWDWETGEKLQTIQERFIEKEEQEHAVGSITEGMLAGDAAIAVPLTPVKKKRTELPSTPDAGRAVSPAAAEKSATPHPKASTTGPIKFVRTWGLKTADTPDSILKANIEVFKMGDGDKNVFGLLNHVKDTGPTSANTISNFEAVETVPSASAGGNLADVLRAQAADMPFASSSASSITLNGEDNDSDITAQDEADGEDEVGAGPDTVDDTVDKEVRAKLKAAFKAQKRARQRAEAAAAAAAATTPEESSGETDGLDDAAVNQEEEDAEEAKRQKKAAFKAQRRAKYKANVAARQVTVEERDYENALCTFVSRLPYVQPAHQSTPRGREALCRLAYISLIQSRPRTIIDLSNDAQISPRIRGAMDTVYDTNLSVLKRRLDLAAAVIGSIFTSLDVMTAIASKIDTEFSLENEAELANVIRRNAVKHICEETDAAYQAAHSVCKPAALASIQGAKTSMFEAGCRFTISVSIESKIALMFPRTNAVHTSKEERFCGNLVKAGMLATLATRDHVLNDPRLSAVHQGAFSTIFAAVRVFKRATYPNGRTDEVQLVNVLSDPKLSQWLRGRFSTLFVTMKDMESARRPCNLKHATHLDLRVAAEELLELALTATKCFPGMQMFPLVEFIAEKSARQAKAELAAKKTAVPVSVHTAAVEPDTALKGADDPAPKTATSSIQVPRTIEDVHARTDPDTTGTTSDKQQPNEQDPRIDTKDDGTNTRSIDRCKRNFVGPFSSSTDSTESIHTCGRPPEECGTTVKPAPSSSTEHGAAHGSETSLPRK